MYIRAPSTVSWHSGAKIKTEAASHGASKIYTSLKLRPNAYIPRVPETRRAAN